MGIASVFGALRRSRSGSFSHREGSSRRGRRFGRGDGSNRSNVQDDTSNGKDSSTNSALFDLELSHRATSRAGDLLARLNPSIHDDSTHASGDPSVRLPSGLLQRIIYLGRPVMEFELDLLQDLRALRSTCSRQPDGQLDLSSLVSQLQDLGYACYLKRNNPADPGHRHKVDPSCLEKLRHEYIMCAGRTDGSLTHWCLVDPRFRDQFAIAQPTPTYDRCLKAVPLEFVGTPLRLQALVETLCAEMAEAFVSQQLTLPPWRKLNSMLSKWFDPEEMPGPQAPAPAPQSLPQMAPTVQLQATAGPPLSPFAAAQGSGAGFALAPAPAAPTGSVLQQQAAAALAERQTSGGSQSFYEALAMHQESMRLQEQAAAAAKQRQSPPQQQPHVGGEARRREDAFAAAARALAEAQQQQQADELQGQHRERSNKPRRRAATRGHLGASSGFGIAAGPASLWAPDAGAGGAAGAGDAAADRLVLGLHESGSWSDLSTILETRSNASSPAAAVLLTATNCLGTSAASRRSVGSSAAIAAASGVAFQPLMTLEHRRSPNKSGQRSSPSPSPGTSSFDAFALQPSPSNSSAATTRADSGAPPAAVAPGMPVIAFAPMARATSLGGGQASPSGSSVFGGSEPGLVERGEAAAGAAAAAAAGSKKKVVSLLAKSLKSVGQKQAWTNLLPSVNTVRRVGSNGVVTAQRTWSWRSNGSEGSESGRRSTRLASGQPSQLE